MQFNNDKFELLRSVHCDYTDIIERKEHLRDLGVIVQEDLLFTNHIAKVIYNVRSKSGWILRSMVSGKPEIMRKVWKCYILPCVDYCSVLWFSQNRPGDIIKIERTQNNFLRKCEGLESSDYWIRLKRLNLQSIQRQLERFTIIYIWKSLEGFAPSLGMQWNSNSHRESILCVPPLSKAHNHIKGIREGSIYVAGPRLFNCLPSCVRKLTGCSLVTFKFLLDSLSTLLPDEPRLNDLKPTSINSSMAFPSKSLIDVLKCNKETLRGFDERMKFRLSR